MVLWELFSQGSLPYSGLSNEEVKQQVLEGYRLNPPPDCPELISEIMIQCLNSIPENRPLFSTIAKTLHESATETRAVDNVN